MSRRSVVILGVILLALTIRLISLAAFGFIDSGGGTDSVTYLLLAKNLFSGRGFTEFGIPHTIHHPLYPVLVGLLWKVAGDIVLAGHLVSVLAGAALVIPVYLLGKDLFGRRTGFYSAVCVAVFPILVYGSNETFSESLYTFFLLSGIAVFWISFRKRKVAGVIPAGMLIGLAFLTHPSGVTFLPVLILFLVVARFTSRFQSWKRIWIMGFGLLLGFSIVCSPFWIYVHRVTGRWQLTGNTFSSDLTLRLLQARGAPQSEVVFRHMEMLYHPSDSPPPHEPIGLFSLALRRPSEFMEVVRYNLIDGYQEVQKSARLLRIPTWLLMLGLAGAFALPALSLVKSRFRGEEILPRVFLAMMFLPALVFVIVAIEHRYVYPFIPLVLIAISRLAAVWRERVIDRGSLPGRYLFYGVAAVVLLTMLAGSSAIIYRKWKKVGIPYEYRLLGEWMRENIPGIEEENVMMFRMGVSHYSGCRWNVFYWGDYAGLVEYLKQNGIKYVVMDDYNLQAIHPELRFLLHAAALPPEFKVIKELTFQGSKARLLHYNPQ